MIKKSGLLDLQIKVSSIKRGFSNYKVIKVSAVLFKYPCTSDYAIRTIYFQVYLPVLFAVAFSHQSTLTPSFFVKPLHSLHITLNFAI
jgi:hypothetical protein